MKKPSLDSAGIQSIEVGVPLLAAVARSVEAITLTDLAKSAEMTPSRAHKYLASFVRAGLVARDSANGRYRLGPLALELGFAAMRHLSAVSISEATMLELRDNLNLTVSLTVWGNQGPTIVRRVESHQMQFAVMRVGSVTLLLSRSSQARRVSNTPASEMAALIRPERLYIRYRQSECGDAPPTRAPDDHRPNARG